MTSNASGGSALPPRFSLKRKTGVLTVVVIAAALVYSLQGVGLSLDRLARGVPNAARLLSEMFPPDFSRIGALMTAILETLQMALSGTVIGALLSLPLAILASRTLVHTRLVNVIARTIIAIARSVPDLIWALLFVVAVGLGPFAGMLAIVVDTIGYCARFYAEAMEEADQGPSEAMTSIGATKLGIIASAVIPATAPSMIATTLYSLEKAVRASVVLGIVGAGGIGMELNVAMQLFLYDQAMAIIILLVVTVVIIEQVSSRIRWRLLARDASPASANA